MSPEAGREASLWCPGALFWGGGKSHGARDRFREQSGHAARVDVGDACVCVATQAPPTMQGRVAARIGKHQIEMIDAQAIDRPWISKWLRSGSETIDGHCGDPAPRAEGP